MEFEKFRNRGRRDQWDDGESTGNGKKRRDPWRDKKKEKAKKREFREQPPEDFNNENDE